MDECPSPPKEPMSLFAWAGYAPGRVVQARRCPALMAPLAHCRRGRKRTAVDGASCDGPAKPSSAVRFKYHEGLTNAVRRTVYVKDFLS